MKHAPHKDYLAYAPLGSGGGSWARDSDPERAITRCAKIAKSDWKIPDGQAIDIGLWDVTGHDSLRMNDGGVWSKGPDENRGGTALPILRQERVMIGRAR